MKRFEQLSSAIGKALKVKSAVLDGKIVALDESGMPAFYHLMRRKCHAVYYAFDLLWLDGKDLRELPLLERKKILRSVLPDKSSWIGYVSFIGHTRAKKLFVKAKDLEHLAAKRKDGRYHRAARWFKVLNPTYSQKAGRQEFFEGTNSIGRQHVQDCERKRPRQNFIYGLPLPIITIFLCSCCCRTHVL
jgi:ATP-dependent DNA ligase